MNKFSYREKAKQGYEVILIRYLYFFSFPLLIAFAYINYVNGLKVSAYMDLSALVLLILSIYLFTKSTKLYLAKSIVLFSLLLTHISALLYGGYANSSFFWFFIFPLIALFLFNKKTAFVWIGTLLVSIFISILLIQLSFLEINYNVELLYVLSLALMVEIYIVNYTQGVLISYKEGLEKLNTELLTTNALVDKYFLIIRTDLKAKIIDVNEAFLELSQYSKEPLIGSDFTQICHSQSEGCLHQAYFSCAVETEDYNTILECERTDGTPYWVEAHMVREYDVKGKEIGFLIFQQDITQRIELEKASITDTLTQVNNRMHFDEISRHRLSEFDRYEIITSLIICDIDNFKEINDKYGHLKGDDVLKKMALLLQKNIRESDTLSRWGGEEFSVLLPQTDIKNAVLVAEKMCNMIEAYDFELDENLTASFGVTVTKDADNQVSWFSRADRALYRAKESGRNQVCSF